MLKLLPKHIKQIEKATGFKANNEALGVFNKEIEGGLTHLYLKIDIINHGILFSRSDIYNFFDGQKRPMIIPIELLKTILEILEQVEVI